MRMLVHEVHGATACAAGCWSHWHTESVTVYALLRLLVLTIARNATKPYVQQFGVYNKVHTCDCTEGLHYTRHPFGMQAFRVVRTFISFHGRHCTLARSRSDRAIREAVRYGALIAGVLTR